MCRNKRLKRMEVAESDGAGQVGNVRLAPHSGTISRHPLAKRNLLRPEER